MIVNYYLFTLFAIKKFKLYHLLIIFGNIYIMRRFKIVEDSIIL